MSRAERVEIEIPVLEGFEQSIEEAKAIVQDRLREERGKVQEQLVVKFLPENLTREGAGMISAMGTRNSFRYEDIAARTKKLPASFHEAVTIVPTEEIQKAGGKLGRIAHSSIMEQVIPGPQPEGGDRAIAVEGISAAVLLDVVGRMRYGALEIFSSRAGVLTGYEIPEELNEHPDLKEDYQNAVETTMEIYRKLTILATAYFLSTTHRIEGEKDYEYRQRVLALALDHSRNVTPMACKIHGTFTFSNALAVQEELTRMWSAYPQLSETRKFCEKTLTLLSNGTPTLLRYTRPRDGMTRQQKFQANLAEKSVFPDSEKAALPKELEGSGITYFIFPEENVDRLAAAIIQRFSNQSFGTILEGVKKAPEVRDKIIEEFLALLNPYDLPPEELGVIIGEFGYKITVGAMMELLRHRPIKKIGAMHTKDLGFLTHPFWFDNFGTQVDGMFRLSFDVCYKTWKKLKEAGLETVAPYLIQRADYMQLYTVETGMDIWRLHSLRTDDGANLDIRGPMRAKHNYLLIKYPSIFKYFPVTYK